MTKKELKIKYLLKFNKLEYEKYDKEHLEEDGCIDLGTEEGFNSFYELFYKEIPNFGDKKEITHNIVEHHLKRALKNKTRVVTMTDVFTTIMKDDFITDLEQEYQIKKTISNLEDIIRKIVKEELNKKL